jgi:hypothetical protein
LVLLTAFVSPELNRISDKANSSAIAARQSKVKASYGYKLTMMGVVDKAPREKQRADST